MKRCAQLNKEILPHASTANVARDMDAIRALLGDKKLNYFGFSYGTFLGATYSSLFPDNYRAMVLDGPIDANGYINKPEAGLREQSAGFERALDRFFQACAQDKITCPFGGPDPFAAYDALIAQANTLAIPAPGFTDDPRPVNGDDILNGTLITLYNKGNWPLLARGLTAASQGDATTMRFLADAAWGNNFDGTFDPGTDRYFTIGAIEQKYPHDIDHFLEAGDNAWGMFEHFWLNRATSRSRTRSGRSTTRTRSRVRSPRRSRHRRCSRSRRPTTPQRRSAARSDSPPSSATSAS